ncbi:MAG TPA: RNA polymerase sigma factor SigJ [Bryobacteraceae bacterium]
MTSIQALDVFVQERPRLFALAYGFLGSRADASDAVQETWIRWQGREVGDVRDPAAWLTTVTARLALDRLRSARVRRETYPGTWLPEPVVDAPSAEQAVLQRSELSVAFLFLLERLGPEERAAFVLREVFDHSYRDISETLEKSEASCRQLVTRARERVRQDRVRAPVDHTEFERLLRRYVDALASGDERGLLELIAPGAVLYGDGGGKALSIVNPLHGPERIVKFLMGLRRKYRGQYELRPTNVNGWAGFLVVLGGQVRGVSAYDISGGKIYGIYHVVNPDKLQPA